VGKLEANYFDTKSVYDIFATYSFGDGNGSWSASSFGIKRLSPNIEIILEAMAS
jgi:hypothetical protein